MDCIFCKIIAGEATAYKVYENEFTLVILDINPISAGHVIIMPKNHFEKLSDMDEINGLELFKTVLIMEKMIASLGCACTNLLQNNGKAAGQEIPHVHVHIIPRYPQDFFRLKYRKAVVTPDMQNYVLKKYKEYLNLP